MNTVTIKCPKAKAGALFAASVSFNLAVNMCTSQSSVFSLLSLLVAAAALDGPVPEWAPLTCVPCTWSARARVCASKYHYSTHLLARTGIVEELVPNQLHYPMKARAQAGVSSGETAVGCWRKKSAFELCPCDTTGSRACTRAEMRHGL